jgi:phytoene dehydrogenase-like protein
MPERPFVLLGQQYLADPSRSHGSANPIYAYAHVPHGYDGDATHAVLGQIERFAPGFRDRVLAVAARGPADLETYNANYVGGDISAGANTARQIVFRPRPALDPYSLGVPGVYLCSSATPPGGGVHGMGGFNAAEAALARL